MWLGYTLNASSDMKHFISAVVLFSSILYLNLSSLWGSYGSAGGTLYHVYCVGIFIIAFISYQLSYPSGRIRKNHFASLICILTFVVVGLLSGYATDVSMLCLVAYCLPAVWVAVYYSEHHNITSIIKWIDLFLPLLCVSMGVSLLFLLRGMATGDGDSYSQGLSYDASYCFLLYLFLLVFGKEFDRFPVFKSKGYRFFSILMLPYLLMIMLFAGGRGALGNLVVGVIYILYLGKKKRRLKFGRLFKYFLIGGMVLTVALNAFSFDVLEVFTRNFHRVFSFFDSGLDISEKTSGRDMSTVEALSQISQHPVIGSGLFTYKDSFFENTELTYPHNLFLEVLIQGGLLYFYFFLIFGLLVLLKAKSLMRDTNQALVILLGIFSLTKLMFSDSYLQNSFFWFFVTYVFNYRRHIPLTSRNKLICAR